LIESVTVTIIGGIIGVLTGYGLRLFAIKGYGISAPDQRSVGCSGRTVSFIVGLFSGTVSSLAGVKAGPIEAMRNE
jgi:hypothetical protein